MTLVRNNFSNVVEAYVKYRRDYVEKAYELIYSSCPDKDSLVLDLGCGTGLVAKHLANFYKHVTGIDTSEKMLEVAKINAPENTDFILAPAENLPFPEGAFDLATVAAAYHWFDYDQAGKEIYRVLKPGGKLCVFWKYAPVSRNEYAPGYLPVFAAENIRKFIPNVPHANKEMITAEIFSRAGFSKVEKKEFDFEDAYTKEEILGFIQSHSTFNLLNDEQKEEYKKLNEERVGDYLVDGKFVFKSTMEMWFMEK